jgi:hypothetical protein
MDACARGRQGRTLEVLCRRAYSRLLGAALVHVPRGGDVISGLEVFLLN